MAAQVADPLGFFFEDSPRELDPDLKGKRALGRSIRATSTSEPCNEGQQLSRSRGRTASSSSGGGVEHASGEVRLRKLRRRIDEYIERNRLDHRVSGIMQNMHPSDVIKVIETTFPEDCRNPSGFAVAQIRRTERDAGRPKDYRWNGKSWDQRPEDFGARSPKGRGRSRETRSRRCGPRRLSSRPRRQRRCLRRRRRRGRPRSLSCAGSLSSSRSCSITGSSSGYASGSDASRDSTFRRTAIKRRRRRR
mmetsp:Transcript_130111/g.259534  ORF Transcript_130111/g.259534 Transcript_130111/m.259534 type:complete len:249 (+) Transcript_130111:61-807(+)